MMAVLILAMPWLIPLTVVLIGLLLDRKKECAFCTGCGPLPDGVEGSDAHHYLFCVACGKPNKPLSK